MAVEFHLTFRADIIDDHVERVSSLAGPLARRCGPHRQPSSPPFAAPRPISPPRMSPTMACMFWLTAGVGLVALSVVLLVVREQAGGVTARKKTTPLDLIYLLKRRDLWPAYAAMLVGMALFYSAVGFVPLYAAAPTEPTRPALARPS